MFYGVILIHSKKEGVMKKLEERELILGETVELTSLGKIHVEDLVHEHYGITGEAEVVVLQSEGETLQCRLLGHADDGPQFILGPTQWRRK